MAGSFRFKRFSIRNDKAALKVGTDAVLLGAAMTVSPEDRTLLDIGTGTGVIALMVAQRCCAAQASMRIVAIDIDGPSAEEAAENFADSPWASCLTAIHTSLADFKPERTFDCIFSNPPFYDNSLKNPDAREAAARHTESLSFREIFAFSAEWLQPEGHLSLILPADQEVAVIRTAVSFGLYPSRIIRIKGAARKPVKRIILEFSRTRKTVAEEMLVLMDGNARSVQYQELTKEFYL